MAKSRQQIRDEMTGLLLRGGLIGVIAFAAAVAFMVIPIQIGKIWPTTSIQTGYRGTGMDVIRFDTQIAATVAANTPPVLGAPIPPEAGAPLEGDAYPFAEAAGVGNLTVANFDRLNAAIAVWVAPEAAFGASDGYLQAISVRHLEMTRAINDEWDAHVGPTGVNCYTCHRGESVPLDTWFSPEPLNNWAGPNAMFQNQATAMNYSTALPVDAMQTYLLETEQLVGVNGYDSRNTTGEPGASIYHTYQTFSLMQHFANSLGVNCTYCHNTRSIADPAGFTPQWASAQIGRAMTQDINNTWIVPDLELLPPERLGPLGDPAKVNCATCHLGAPQTFNGESAVVDFPELVSAEPVYE